MRSLSFILTLFVFTSAFAANYNYKNYWSKTDLKNSQVQLSVYTKDSPLAYLKNIATVTVSENNKDSYENVLKFFKNSVGTKKWNSQTVDGLEIAESYEPQSNALYRLAYNKKTKQFSIGAVKVRFLLPSYLEIHQMQVEKLTGSPTKKTAQMIYELLVPPAQADLGSLLGSIGNSITTGLGNISNGVSGFNTRIDNATGSVNNLAGSVNNAGDRFVTGANTASNALNNAGTKIESGANRIGTSIDGAGNKIESGANTLSNSLDRNTDKLTESMSAKNVAKLAAVGTLTSVAVSSLVTFAAQGTWELAKRAFYEMKGEFSPEEREARIKNFENSLMAFQKISPSLVELDSKLTVFSSFISQYSNLPAEAALAKIEADIVDAKRRHTEASVEKTGCADCSEKALLEIKNLEEMKKIVATAGGSMEYATKLSCENMDSIYSSWVSAERQLNQARAGIIRDARVFMGLVSSTADISSSWQEQRKQNNACTAAPENRISDMSKSDIQMCDQDPSSIRSTCVSLRAARKEIASCQIAAGALVSEDHRADLNESAAKFNESIADLSSELSTLDCTKSKNGSCVQAGPYKEMLTKMQNRLDSTYKSCPDRRFAKSVSRAKVEAAPKAVAKAEAQVESQQGGGNILSNIFQKITTVPAAQTTSNAYGAKMIPGQYEAP